MKNNYFQRKITRKIAFDIILNFKTTLLLRNNLYVKAFQEKKKFKTQCSNKEIPLNIHERKNENLTQKKYSTDF